MFGTRGQKNPPGALPASCAAVVQEAIAGRAALYLPLAINSALFSRPPPPDSSRAAAARLLLCLRAYRLVISPDSGRWNRPLGTDSRSTPSINQSIIGDEDPSPARVSRKPYSNLPRFWPSPYICVQQPLTLIFDKYQSTTPGDLLWRPPSPPGHVRALAVHRVATPTTSSFPIAHPVCTVALRSPLAT